MHVVGTCHYLETQSIGGLDHTLCKVVQSLEPLPYVYSAARRWSDQGLRIGKKVRA
jgi:hypothetical protein